MSNYFRNLKHRYIVCKVLSIGIGWHYTDLIFIVTGKVL